MTNHRCARRFPRHHEFRHSKMSASSASLRLQPSCVLILIGFAYDPFADHKTSIRGGFGIFHQPIVPGTTSVIPQCVSVGSIGPNNALYPVPFVGNVLTQLTLTTGGPSGPARPLQHAIQFNAAKSRRGRLDGCLRRVARSEAASAIEDNPFPRVLTQRVYHSG
jgi:hypothetical protein